MAKITEDKIIEDHLQIMEEITMDLDKIIVLNIDKEVKDNKDQKEQKEEAIKAKEIVEIIIILKDIKKFEWK
jgi:hypothetical protein